MTAIWIALLGSAWAVETIPTETLADHLASIRDGIGAEKLAIGYSGYDNEERLKGIVGAIDFVVARRLASTGDPEKLMKGVMKKAGSGCGFVITGGTRNVSLTAVGECEPDMTDDEVWAQECREKGLTKMYPEGPSERVELLRPSMPEGLERDDWAEATSHFATAFAACVAETGLPETARLTVKMGWDKDGHATSASIGMGEVDDEVKTCAVRVASCLPDVGEAEGDRSLNQVVRIVEPAPEPEPADEEEKESGEGEAAEGETAEGEAAPE